MVPAAIALGGMMSASRLILQGFCGTDEVGLYAVAASLSSGVALATNAFTQAWGPFAFSILKDEGANRVYARVLDLYAFLGCALCTALALFAPLLLRVLTTEAYYAAASCVAYLGFAVLLNGAGYIASLGASIGKKSIPMALSIGFGALVCVSLNFLLVPWLGRNGAAIGTAIGYAASAIYLFRVSQRVHFIPYRWHISLICLAVSWILIGVDWVFLPGQGWRSLLVRAAMMLSFVPLGAFLGLLRRDHLRQLVGWRWMAPKGTPDGAESLTV